MPPPPRTRIKYNKNPGFVLPNATRNTDPLMVAMIEFSRNMEKLDTKMLRLMDVCTGVGMVQHMDLSSVVAARAAHVVNYRLMREMPVSRQVNSPTVGVCVADRRRTSRLRRSWAGSIATCATWISCWEKSTGARSSRSATRVPSS